MYQYRSMVIVSSSSWIKMGSLESGTQSCLLVELHGVLRTSFSTPVGPTRGPIRGAFTLIEKRVHGLGDDATSSNKLHGLLVVSELLDNSSRGSEYKTRGFSLGREDSLCSLLAFAHSVPPIRRFSSRRCGSRSNTRRNGAGLVERTFLNL